MTYKITNYVSIEDIHRAVLKCLRRAEEKLAEEKVGEKIDYVYFIAELTYVLIYHDLKYGSTLTNIIKDEELKDIFSLDESVKNYINAILQEINCIKWN